MDFNLRQIRAFVAVARLGSFTRAAALLHVAQPTLTVQIRKLEQALAVRLFDRTSRSVQLTQTGRDLLPTLAHLVQDLDGLMNGVRNQGAGYQGMVRIAALPTAAAALLPPAIKSFRDAHPGAEFRVRDVIARRVLALVDAEDVDLGIAGGTAGSAAVDVLLSIEDRMHAVFPEGHPLAAAATVTPDLLVRHPLIMLDPDTSVRAVVEAGFHAAGLIPVAAGEATYMMTAVGMVRAGLGITILPSSAQEIRVAPGIASRPIEAVGFVRQISLVKKAGRTLSPVAGHFARHLVATCEPAAAAA
ncbi:LysR family transcriptional regulator [Phreatobacter cathodiphilus]|uniref:LysR family transcriptional regulator n=1 Tax=Phreatobacter cathodiphilus TaxID=1868589 RepID=A0A2S0NCJ0_9HYPH|nr:LysR family transcriptional regulator [Phreatobacter cathodiphilus]AVO45756.1 LysR family transcriptional regulator [Phreatobacter cathodiphilus]